MPGRPPTNLDNGRTRTCMFVVGVAWVLFGTFLSRISVHFSLSLSL